MSNYRVRILIALALSLCLLPACGKGGGTSSTPPPEEPDVSVVVPLPEPEPEPVLPFLNPLTGEGAATDIGKDRPVAIMINNLKKALPQLGVSQADIIYECPAEGGITRMLAVYQSVDGVSQIGSVRSARAYYVALAAGLDSIFLHAGGSPGAYTAIKTWGVTAMDCVNGPYEGTLFWRDAARRKSAGMEHSVLTSGEKITQLFPTYSRLRRQHEADWTSPLHFTDDGTPAGGEPAQTLTVRFSNYKTGVFQYDADTGLYGISQYDAPYVDGNTDTQVSVRNVLVLRAPVSAVKGDTAGRLDINLVGSGEGMFLCGGKWVPITWAKKSNTGAMTFTTSDGQALELGVGKSYINIVGKDYQVTIT